MRRNLANRLYFIYRAIKTDRQRETLVPCSFDSGQQANTEISPQVFNTMLHKAQIALQIQILMGCTLVWPRFYWLKEMLLSLCEESHNFAAQSPVEKNNDACAEKNLKKITDAKAKWYQSRQCVSGFPPQLEPQEDLILELKNMLAYRLRCNAAACAYKE